MIITTNDIDCIFDSDNVGKLKNPDQNIIKYKKFRIYLHIDKTHVDKFYYCKIYDLFNNEIEYGYLYSDHEIAISKSIHIIDNTKWSYLLSINKKLIYYYGKFLQYLHSQLDKIQD